MPIYEYRCRKGHTFEVMQRISDDPVASCTTCESPVERVFHPVAVHFKGSGFYTTDYGSRKRSGEGSEGAADKEGAKDGAGKEGAGKDGAKETAAKDGAGKDGAAGKAGAGKDGGSSRSSASGSAAGKSES